MMQKQKTVAESSRNDFDNVGKTTIFIMNMDVLEKVNSVWFLF
jgi:hypothetical protein